MIKSWHSCAELCAGRDVFKMALIFIYIYSFFQIKCNKQILLFIMNCIHCQSTVGQWMDETVINKKIKKNPHCEN
jgi:hypothetical protein